MALDSVHKPRPSFQFIPSNGNRPLETQSPLKPRLGRVTLSRPGSNSVSLETPNLLTTTSRGLIPHLSRDHVGLTKAIRWTHIPFESFLDRTPPVPTLQSGTTPLHTFLGYAPEQSILSMSLRDPADDREMPPNGHDFVSAYCIRGVKKVSPQLYRSLVLSTKPDLVVALSDTPFTPHPHSQKRLTKSIERSLAWISGLIGQPPPAAPQDPTNAPLATTTGALAASPLAPELGSPAHQLNVLVHMAGGTALPARQAFSEGLVEMLFGPEHEAIKPYQRLSDGVCGFKFDLAPLRNALLAEKGNSIATEDGTATQGSGPSSRKAKQDSAVVTQHARLLAMKSDPSIAIPTSALVPLLRASLGPLVEDQLTPRSAPANRDKIRIANTAKGPHEMLQLIAEVGIDLFDARWAQRAADIGVALDYVFPAPASTDAKKHGPAVRTGGKRDLGHNLYSPAYAHDFGRLSAEFADGLSASGSADGDIKVCPCASCSPVSDPAGPIVHSRVDSERGAAARSSPPSFDPPFSRAYIHHLLHTHEMSSHALLVMHNLAVMDEFFRGVRNVIARSPSSDVADFISEVERFGEFYDEEMTVFEEARSAWREVELARGRGRLAREREKEKQEEATVGTVVNFE